MAKMFKHPQTDVAGTEMHGSDEGSRGLLTYGFLSFIISQQCRELLRIDGAKNLQQAIPVAKKTAVCKTGVTLSDVSLKNQILSYGLQQSEEGPQGPKWHRRLTIGRPGLEWGTTQETET